MYAGGPDAPAAIDALYETSSTVATAQQLTSGKVTLGRARVMQVAGPR